VEWSKTYAQTNGTFFEVGIKKPQSGGLIRVIVLGNPYLAVHHYCKSLEFL